MQYSVVTAGAEEPRSSGAGQAFVHPFIHSFLVILLMPGPGLTVADTVVNEKGSDLKHLREA